MARAMKKAVEAGREAFLAGRMPKKLYAGEPEFAHQRHDRPSRPPEPRPAISASPSVNAACAHPRHPHPRAPHDARWLRQAAPRAEHARIRSFVLRQGRVSDAQRRALDALLPRFGIPYAPTARSTSSALFGRRAPTMLEIGFGMGETTARDRRRRIPTTTYLGIEVHTPGVGQPAQAHRRARARQRARDPARRGRGAAST